MMRYDMFLLMNIGRLLFVSGYSRIKVSWYFLFSLFLCHICTPCYSLAIDLYMQKMFIGLL